MYAVLILAILSNVNCLNQNLNLDNRLNFFDTDLLKYVTGQSGNAIVSPASIKSTLAMILEGSVGITAEEIRSVLRLSPYKQEFREQLNTYLQALQLPTNSTDIILHNTNVIFMSDKLKVKKDYEQMIQKVYYAKIKKLNFKDSVKTAMSINDFVKNVTAGLITSIVEPVDIHTSADMILTNVLYFRGKWLHEFNAKETRSGCFYNRQICKKVAMMELHTNLKYAFVENLRAHAVELPYVNTRYSMILLVPQDREGLSNVIRDFPYVNLPQIVNMMEPTDVELMMPKFKVEFSTDLAEALQNMHIKSLFTKNGNLSGIFEGSSTSVNSIFHRVHMSVDESGTVAAAATSAMIIPLIAEYGVNLNVDRPFAFFIRDNKLGLILFEGKIEEPNEFVEISNVNSKKENQEVKSHHSQVQDKFPLIFPKMRH